MILLYQMITFNANKFSYSFFLSRRWFYNSKPHLSSVNHDYVNEMYNVWIKDPSSVHISWDSYFRQMGGDLNRSTASGGSLAASPPTQRSEEPVLAKIEDNLQVARIIKAYQKRGHLMADLDPLQISRGPHIKKQDNRVLGDMYIPDMNTVYTLPSFTYIGGKREEITLKEIIETLERIYCSTIGVEYTSYHSETEYLKEYFEYPNKFPVLSKEEKIRTLEKISHTYQLENFLAKKWPSEKRFGIDGSESTIPAINYLIETASDLGAKTFIIGMGHRGRLNILANVIKVDLQHIFTQFLVLEPDKYSSGDVKYHLGTRNTFGHPVSKKPITISLISNASHLESSATIVEGRTAGEQIFMENKDKNKVWPILIHGDAAICGQGVVYETFHLSELHGFNTGGTIHVVFNNQIGYTTDPYKSRSSEYCTCVGKINESPVFHVNGDDIEAVMKVTKVAAEYRAKFQRDVILDIIAYRRLGHNETDDPTFTQPLMYKKIHQMKPVHKKYAEQLINEKVVTKEQIDKIEKEYEEYLQKGYDIAQKTNKLVSEVWLDSPWKGFFDPKKDPLVLPETGAPLQVLKTIGDAISTPPKNFNLHRGLQRIFSQRKKNLKNDIVDWSCGESFAIGSLLQEGIFVRLSGQDSERGTFSHRHHVLHDQEKAKNRVNVLEGIFPNQAEYSLNNSSLSEMGVLGFEVGFSLVNPNSLVMWEAQFGDFCNSAQICIDQYICSGEGKWIRQTGTVLLLPHGMEGMGPEHSSARMERFLQLSDDDDSEVTKSMPRRMKKANWFIANPTTPANFFHVLRRQVKLNYRKPLIVFTPKFLLRYPGCVSSFSDFAEKTKFRPYIADPLVKPSKDVKKLLLCSGKVYYDLVEAREKAGLDNKIAIARLEQISPVPYEDIIIDSQNNFPNSRVFWVQEEHKNQGAWTYILPRLNKAIGNEKGPVNYIGRAVSSTSAAGYKTIHDKEKYLFLTAAMKI